MMNRILALIVALALSSCGSNPQQGPPRMTPEVGVVTLVAQPVITTIVLPGRIAAVATAEVRPQIDGIVQARLFEEGSFVRAGQPLYQIDPRVYRASRDQAAAQLENAQAAVTTAQAKAARYGRLQDADAVARQDVDDAIAAARQAQANVRQYRATLNSANVNLGFTRIAAPISGRIGRSLYTRGALVTANQTTALATISQLDPVFVDIQQSSAALLDLRESLRKDGVVPARAAVRMTLENGRQYPLDGVVEFGEVTVDTTTGTVTFRARFPNPDNLLMPGMFVRVSVPQTIVQQGILAPQQGIARDARGHATALIVGRDSKVVQRQVTVGQAIGNTWLVIAGLRPGDRLVVEGGDNVQPGTPVKPVAVRLGR